VSLDLTEVDPTAISGLSNEDLRTLAAEFLGAQGELRKECAIRYYRPVSERALEVHKSTANYVGIGGGNRASKTEVAIAEAVALATGFLPEGMEDIFRSKFRGPIKIRMIVESHTTTLVPTILPKLQWWQWNGIDEPGGERGHWGWIPKQCLVNGDWVQSWSEKNRLLRINCFDPDDPARKVGESTMQFMSHSQDPSDFASGEFHIVLIDEPTRYSIWRENIARVRSVNGRIILAMTWPDEPGIPVDWIYDEIYDRAQPGPNKHDEYDWFELWTTENPHLDQVRVQADLADASDQEMRVRFLGQPIRFSNRIHPLFTDTPDHWCFRCQKPVVPHYDEHLTCECGSSEVTEFCHVSEFDVASWPCLFALDPHPRKPHMFCWVAIDPSDDLWVCAEGEVEDDPAAVAAAAFEIESMLGLYCTQRVIDPNMGRQPVGGRRDSNWQEEFERAGLNCELGDASDVGRAKVNEYLKPDQGTWRPRLHVHVRCSNTIFQMKRYTWDEHKYRMEKDIKQSPRAKYDDYPSMLRYILNLEPNFRWLREGAPVVGRMGERRGAY